MDNTPAGLTAESTTVPIDAAPAARSPVAVDATAAVAPSEVAAPPKAPTWVRWAGRGIRLVVIGGLAFRFAVPLEAWLTGEGVNEYLQVAIFYLLVVAAITLATSPLLIYLRAKSHRSKPAGISWKRFAGIVLMVHALSLAYYLLALAAMHVVGGLWWCLMLGIGFFFLFAHHCVFPTQVLSKADLLPRDTKGELFERLAALALRAKVLLVGMSRVEPAQPLGRDKVGVLLAVSGRGRSLLVGRATLDELTREEFEVAFAHELCRDAFHHTTKILAAGFVGSLAEYVLVAWFTAAWVDRQYGAIDYEQWPASAIVAVMFAFAVVSLPFDRAKRWLAGRLERQSDRIALRCATSEATFVSLLTKRAKLTDYDPYLYSSWRADPIIVLTPEERLTRAKQ